MIYDVTTKNISFLKVAAELKKRGVKNNKFMLTLLNEKLVGVDPRSKNLTNEQKIAIYEEICLNKWYFLREVVRIPVEGLEDGLTYGMNLGNLTMSYLKSKNTNQVVILPRQHGKTIGEVCDDVWNMNFACQNTNIIYLNKEFKDSKENLRRYKNIRLLLPAWLRELISDKNDKDNEELKINASRNNSLKAMPAATTTDAADKLGRGLTTALIYADEFAFLKFNDIVYMAMLPAWQTASSNAKKNNSPYGITITTTPNNLDVQHGAFCKKIIDNAAKFTYECFDMTDEELQQYIDSASKNNFLYVEYSYKELGKDDAWFQKCVREFQGDLGKIKREILLEWPRSTDSSVFGEEQLEKLYSFVNKTPVARIMVENRYLINFYEKIDLNRNYILSCDVSGGLSSDNSVIAIIDPSTFKPIGYFKNNKIDTDSFRKLIYTLMTLYFRNSYLLVERNSYGLNILDTLMKDPVIEPRMYKEQREQVGEKTQKDGFTVKRKTKNIIYGVDTTATSRRLMYDLLMTIVDEEYDKVIAPELYDDISKLERKKNGKIEAMDGEHDDCLMAYLIFRYAVFYGKCFRDKFGISPIPTAGNVKVVSSEATLKQIERVIMVGNSDQSFQQTDMYQQLLAQSRKIGQQSSEKSVEENRKVQSFINICNLNSD